MSGQSSGSGVATVGADTAGGAGTGAMVGGPYGAVIGGVIGAGVGIWGALKSASDQADIDNQKAALEGAQADEVISRERINDTQLQESAYRNKLEYGSQFAASGHEGIGIGSMLEIQRRADLQQSLNDREADFQARMIRAGAGMENQLASNVMTSGYFSAAGTLIGAGGKLMSPSSGITGPGQPQGLPSVPEGY